MNRIKTRLRYLICGFPLVFVMGCTELGSVITAGDIYGNGSQSEISGEVRSVNARSQEIEIRTDDRQTEVVRYDGQTRVVYRGRDDYTVANLEAGDYVAMQVQTERPGYLYTDLVRVSESVQDRGGASSGRDRFAWVEGRVESVNPRRGEFEIRDDSGRRVVVALPYNARRSDVERLQSLRRGDYVRVEGKFLNPDRFELEAFV
jgi:hypothetical protein